MGLPSDNNVIIAPAINVYRSTYTMAQYSVNNDNLTPPEVITTPQVRIY